MGRIVLILSLTRTKMKLFQTLAVISTAEASMPYYPKCRALKLREAGMNIPDKNIIDRGENCDEVMARNFVAAGDDDYTKPVLWKNHWSPSENKYIVPYYFEEGYEDIVKNNGKYTGEESLDKILRDADRFEEHTCIKLVEITDRDEVDNWESRIYIDSGEGPAWDCGAGAGMIPGDQPMHMGVACAYEKGITVHEFMHNLGFEHEHQRPDRHLYIDVHPSLDDFDYALLETEDWHGDLTQPYDWKSALNYGVHRVDEDEEDEGLYNIAVAGTNGDEPAPISRYQSRGGMSDGDIYRINFAYDCDVNDKCADEGEDPCGEGEHECLNQPKGFNCNCAEGFLKHDLPGNKQRCSPDFCANAAEDRCGGQEHECINDVDNYKCGCKNGLVQMWDSENEVFTCETDFCAEAGSDVCGGDPSECVNVFDFQDYICNHCPSGYTHNESNKCIDVNECLTENVCEAADEGVNAVQCVNVPGSYQCLHCPFCTTQSRTFDQQKTMINDVIHLKLFNLISNNKSNFKWKNKLESKINDLEPTNEDKSRCDPPFIPTTLTIGGATKCELAESVIDALKETAQEWICSKKQARKFKKQFGKLLKKFNKKNC